MKVRLSREEQSKLTKAIENVDSLKSKVKLQMASIKVVDLKKKKEQQAKALEQEKAALTSAFKRNKKTAPTEELGDSAKTNANINFMIIQAREQVNQALKCLAQKDSKLDFLQI